MLPDPPVQASAPFARFGPVPRSFAELKKKHAAQIESVVESFAKSGRTQADADELVNTHLLFLLRSSWLLPRWSDFAPMVLAAVGNASGSMGGTVAADDSPVMKGAHSTERAGGLYELDNFCVTDMGALASPPSPSPTEKSVAAAVKMQPFRGRDEHPLFKTIPSVPGFLSKSQPVNQLFPHLFNSTADSRSSSPLVFLPITVLIYPMTAYSAITNGGHNMHRMASLNAMRTDVGAELLLALTSIESSPSTPTQVVPVAKEIFQNGCRKADKDDDCEWRSEGVRALGFASHYQVLGLPVAAINRFDDNSKTTLTKETFLQAALLGREDGNDIVRKPSFMCFKKGFMYHNHIGPEFEEKEEDAESPKATFSAFRFQQVHDGPIGSGSNVRGEFKQIVVSGPLADSAFDFNQSSQVAKEPIPGVVNRWHYAMGMKSWSSVRKRALLQRLRNRGADFDTSVLPQIKTMTVMVNGRPVSVYPQDRASAAAPRPLRLLFVVRTSSRYIPGFPSFAPLLSKSVSLRGISIFGGGGGPKAKATG